MLLKILVLQHLAVEHPGILRDFLRADGLSWDTVELDRGEAIPDVAGYDVMLVMGGPQDVWQEDIHPWLKLEKSAIRRFVVELQRPYLGICLGHQLLAEAIGGCVAPASAPEVGVLEVVKTEAGRRDRLLAGLEDPGRVLQWHGAEVTALPEGVEVLAMSNACAVQAFRYGRTAYGVQFHVEATGDTVRDWAAIPEYQRALEQALGKGVVAQLERDVASELASFNRQARSIYEHIKGLRTDREAAA